MEDTPRSWTSFWSGARRLTLRLDVLDPLRMISHPGVRVLDTSGFNVAFPELRVGHYSDVASNPA